MYTFAHAIVSPPTPFPKGTLEMRSAVFVVVIFVLAACIHAAPEPQSNLNPSSPTTAAEPDPELATLTEQFLKDEPPCSSIPVPGHVVISQAGFQV